jgi:hypothetical protein
VALHHAIELEDLPASCGVDQTRDCLAIDEQINRRRDGDSGDQPRLVGRGKAFTAAKHPGDEGRPLVARPHLQPALGLEAEGDAADIGG